MRPLASSPLQISIALDLHPSLAEMAVGQTLPVEVHRAGTALAALRRDLVAHRLRDGGLRGGAVGGRCIAVADGGID
jgi:hypothetical protein